MIASQRADREGNDGSRVGDARSGDANEAGKGAESHEASKNKASKKGDEGQTQGRGDEGRQIQAHEEGSAETVGLATTTES